MSKKFIIIAILLLVVTAAFFAYKKGYFQPNFWDRLKVGKLLTFEIKNQELVPEAKDFYQKKFNETKEKLQKNQSDINQWLFLGVLKKGVGDFEGSRDVWLYVSKTWPNDSLAFANLADLYANFLNEPQKGLAAIKKAIELMPQNINYYLAMADIYRYRLPGQEAMYEKTLLGALQKFPDEVNLIAPLAAYYRQTDQVQKAIEWYEKLVRLAPDNETAKQDLQELKKQ